MVTVRDIQGLFCASLWGLATPVILNRKIQVYKVKREKQVVQNYPYSKIGLARNQPGRWSESGAPGARLSVCGNCGLRGLCESGLKWYCVCGVENSVLLVTAPAPPTYFWGQRPRVWCVSVSQRVVDPYPDLVSEQDRPFRGFFLQSSWINPDPGEQPTSM